MKRWSSIEVYFAKRERVKYSYAASRESAAVVVPLLLSLLDVSSVVDVGCGDGSWLACFMDNGIRDVVGVDAAPSPDFALDAGVFHRSDLTYPLDLGRRFDLALCLEVGEHLSGDAAGTLVHTLTHHSDVIVFSAAVPGQGGSGHINEQWPEYWSDLFAENDFVALDVLRPRIWTNPRVMYWYAQNMLLFVNRQRIEKLPRVARESTWGGPLAVVHPRALAAVVAPKSWWTHSKAAARALLRTVGV